MALLFSLNHRRRQPLRLLILAALGVAALRGFEQLLRELAFQLTAPMTFDAGLYLAVGRGILNGLVPYRDLFETKPPGMFLLGALSLWVGGDERLALVLQAIVLVAIPLGLVAIAWHDGKGNGWFRRAVGCLLAFLFAVGLVLYVGERAGHIQTESFGAFFAMLYLLVIGWNKDSMGWARIAVASVCLLCSLGLKEPFLFSIAAAALLMNEDWRSFVRAFGMPLLLAAGGGVLILALLGYLGPYVHIYLPRILGDRLPAQQAIAVAGTTSGTLSATLPLWLRGLRISKLYIDLWWFAPLPLFGYVIACLWAAIPVWKHPAAGWRSLTVAVATIGGGLYAFHSAFLLFDLLAFLNFAMPVHDPFFLLLCLGNLALVGACMTGLGFLYVRRRRVLFDVAKVLLATYLIVFTIGSGNFSGQHFVFAIPAYMAAFLLFARALGHQGITPPVQALGFALVVLLAGMALLAPQGDAPDRVAIYLEHSQPADPVKAQAAQVDALMDHCGFSRYVTFATDELWAFTRHSPLDLYATQVYAFGPHPDLGFRAQVLQDLATTPVTFLGPHKVDSTTGSALIGVLRQFGTRTAPDCARPYLPIPGLIPIFHVAGA